MPAARILFIVLFFGLSQWVNAAEAPGRRTEELMHKSGLWTQLAHFHGQIRSGIQESRAQEGRTGRPGLTDADVERVVAAARAAFAPERMRQWVQAELARFLTAGEEAQVLVWLSSDLGTRITRLEEVGEEPANYEKMIREAPAHAAALPAARMERLRRLEKAVRGGEAGTEITINIATAVAYGVASTSRFPDPAAVERLRAQFEAQRPRMLEVLTQQAVESFAWIYRTLPDAELDRYIAFAETPAGRAYHEATIKAMGNAFVRGSREMGERIGRAAGEEPKRGL